MSKIQTALNVVTGYASAIKSADTINDKLGGKDSLVGRGITGLAGGLAGYAMIPTMAELTSNKFSKAAESWSAGNEVQAVFGDGLTGVLSAGLTAHVATRAAAAVITAVMPNLRENMEKAGYLAE